MRARCFRFAILYCNLLVMATMQSGCGFERFAPVLPDQIQGFSLAALESIQDDERLTDNEKRDQIRAAVNAPATVEGDRLVEFLFTLNVP
ncbi:MAG: hypothetical protein H6818_13720 [Phycisphaerales bacterium]|nr:hypothetical protein [Phycisphaerales bacterium]MCB9862140.1 hypothetical protein [Phycisphaerales bacterium]